MTPSILVDIDQDSEGTCLIHILNWK